MSYLKLLLLLALASIAVPACKTTPTTPDSFYEAVVTCTAENTRNVQAGAAVLSCLSNTLGGNPSACLLGLVAEGHWLVDEIACLVRQYASVSAVRINSGVPEASDATVLKNANQFLKEKKIGFR